MSNKSLTHFGILGMKWGHRNTRPDSPKTTSAKIAAEKAWDKLSKIDVDLSSDPHSKAKAAAFDKADKEYNQANRKYKTLKELDKYSPKTASARTKADKAWDELAKLDVDYSSHPNSREKALQFEKALKKYDDAEREFKNLKILDKLSEGPKSKRQLELESKYKNKGMSDDDAAVSAYKRARTENILKVVGGIAVTGAVVYTAYRTKKNVDMVNQMLNDPRFAGKALNTKSIDDTIAVADAFFNFIKPK